MDKLLSALLKTTRRIQDSCSGGAPTPAQPEAVPKYDRKASVIGGCGQPVADLLGRQAGLVLALHESLARDRTGTPGAVAADHGAVNEGLLRKRLGDLLELADGKFMAFRFEILPDCWRELYSSVRILTFHLDVLKSAFLRGEASEEAGAEVDELVKTLDMAMIVAGGGPGDGRAVINTLLELLERAWLLYLSSGVISEAAKEGRDAKRRKLVHEPGSEEQPTAWEAHPSFSNDTPFEPPVSRPAPCMSGLSMDAFQRYINPATNPEDVVPVVFTDLMSGWPALCERPWRKPAYLLSRTFGGRRYVPVEVGRSYVDEGWTQKLIPFRDFLSAYIDPSLSAAPSAQPTDSNNDKATSSAGDPNPVGDRGKGYLAQHDLFAQIPSLRNDILLPDYLWTDPPPHPSPSQNKPKVDGPQLNAWFGPAKTITPLHIDSMHNLLCQVVGRKYVRMYPPRCTPAMLPRGVEAGVDMGNTSGVDVGVVEGWDEGEDGLGDGEDGAEQDGEAYGRRMRLFREAEYWDCILEPGETLYIPIGWWHYVRSLSVSFSVSFWWN